MHLGEFIVAEVQAGKSIASQLVEKAGAVLLILHLNPDEDVGSFPFGHAIAELRQASSGQLAAERAQASW